MARSSVTDGATGALRAASSTTLTNCPELEVHILESSEANAFSRFSISSLAASLRIGVSLEGSDGSRSGSGGEYSIFAACVAGGRSGSGVCCGRGVDTTAANTNGRPTAATHGRVFDIGPGKIV